LPGKVLILNTIGLLLQYVLLLLVYYFLYRVSKIIVQDIRGANAVALSDVAGCGGTAAFGQAELKVIDGAHANLTGKV
jgi:hypothetical protein